MLLLPAQGRPQHHFGFQPPLQGVDSEGQAPAQRELADHAPHIQQPAGPARSRSAAHPGMDGPLRPSPHHRARRPPEAGVRRDDQQVPRLTTLDDSSCENLRELTTVLTTFKQISQLRFLVTGLLYDDDNLQRMAGARRTGAGLITGRFGTPLVPPPRDSLRGTIVELIARRGPAPHRFRHPWSPDHQGWGGMPDAAGVRPRP